MCFVCSLERPPVSPSAGRGHSRDNAARSFRPGQQWCTVAHNVGGVAGDIHAELPAAERRHVRR